ncbi:MAG: hypothetical protein M1820_005524 [Bogoriella megaspora]|nr:MAG: hypothetical protein M1820_005524 [Bogoriella megaspora]
MPMEETNEQARSSFQPEGAVESYMVHRLPLSLDPSFQFVKNAAISGSKRAAMFDMTQEQIEPSQADCDSSTSVEVAISTPDKALDRGDEQSLKDIYQGAEAEKANFKLAMSKYEAAASKSKYKTNITITSSYSWQDVLSEANAAMVRDSDSSDLWGKIRRALRGLGKNNSALTAWTRLLPSDSEYFSVLCGGLKLIIGNKALTRLHCLREGISKALEAIPNYLSFTQRTLHVFNASEDLHRSSAALYESTIHVLHHILGFLNKSVTRKLVGAMFKQDGYEQDLADKVDTMKAQAEHLGRSAQACSYENQVDTNERVHSLQNDTGEIQRQLSFNRDENFWQNLNLGKLVVNENASTRNFLREQIGEEINKQLTGVIASFFSANPRIDIKTQDVRGPLLPIRKSASNAELTQSKIELKRELLLNLNYESSITRRDMDANLSTIWRLPQTVQDRAVAVAQHGKLRAWIKDTGSSAFFINGNSTPISFISARLLKSIHDSNEMLDPDERKTFALSFFCENHTKQADVDAGPIGLMHSIIAQLLLCYDFNLKFMRRLQKVDYSDVTHLSKIFRSLILQLPQAGVIFCVLDSVTAFEERTTYREDMEFVVDELASIAEDGGDDQCVFKLLLTSPGNSKRLYQKLQNQSNVIWMPTRIPPAGGFRETKWTLGID